MSANEANTLYTSFRIFKFYEENDGFKYLAVYYFYHN